MPTIPRASACWAPYQSTPKPRPSCTRPSTNFVGVEGSRSRFARKPQSAVNTSPNTRMKIGFVAWNTDAGTSLPPRPMPMWSAVRVQLAVASGR